MNDRRKCADDLEECESCGSCFAVTAACGRDENDGLYCEACTAEAKAAGATREIR